jgi:TonB family protein
MNRRTRTGNPRRSSRIESKRAKRENAMNTSKLFLHAVAALCLAAAFAFLPSVVVPQEAQQPRLLKKVIPAYPEILKKMNVSGTVKVQVTISADGSVKDVEVRGGNAIFIDSVAAAVRNWKFVASDHQRTAEITVNFLCCSTVTTNP